VPWGTGQWPSFEEDSGVLGVKKELNLRSNTAALDAKGRLFVLYAATFTIEGHATRRMMGIYKIVDGKLHMRQPIEYFQTIGGIPIGSPTRIEYPEDFS